MTCCKALTIYVKAFILGYFVSKRAEPFCRKKQEKVVMTVLLPSIDAPSDWLSVVTAKEGAWPMDVPIQRHLARPNVARTFKRLQKGTVAKHLWGVPSVKWSISRAWLVLKHPVKERYEEIEGKFRQGSKISTSPPTNYGRERVRRTNNGFSSWNTW